MHGAGFRSHVWGFFFHIDRRIKGTCKRMQVFVPMFGDSFFTISSTIQKPSKSTASFRPHVWGFFFHNSLRRISLILSMIVFVPMYGDSFFTGIPPFIYQGRGISQFSSPCMGILFSQCYQVQAVENTYMFSSPCMGILFSRATCSPRTPIMATLFSSPCMGILFSPLTVAS